MVSKGGWGLPTERLRRKVGPRKLSIWADQRSFFGYNTLLIICRSYYLEEFQWFKRQTSQGDVGKLWQHYLFLTNMNKYNAHAAECCKICLEKLASNDVTGRSSLRNE
jgi:hypothetical protein